MLSRLLLLLVLCATGVKAGDTVSLPLPEHPTSVDLARITNHFVGLGEEQTITALKKLWNAAKDELRIEFEMREQIGWISRLVFITSNGKPLRAPRFGALSLPWNSMKDEDWPNYPLAESEGVFFILSQGYMLAGMPEDPEQYIEYCRSTGAFRTQAVKIPSEQEAEHALNKLLFSRAWLKIKWKDSQWNSSSGGFSYDMLETRIIAYLKAQIKVPAPSKQ